MDGSRKPKKTKHNLKTPKALRPGTDPSAIDGLLNPERSSNQRFVGRFIFLKFRDPAEHSRTSPVNAGDEHTLNTDENRQHH
jgi:hypothetical protein